MLLIVLSMKNECVFYTNNLKDISWWYIKKHLSMYSFIEVYIYILVSRIIFDSPYIYILHLPYCQVIKFIVFTSSKVKWKFVAKLGVNFRILVCYIFIGWFQNTFYTCKSARFTLEGFIFVKIDENFIIGITPSPSLPKKSHSVFIGCI